MLLTTLSLAHAFTVENLGEIETYIHGEADAAGIPAFAFAIATRDAGVVLATGYGAANPSGAPIDADTPFQIGSLTKSFTALAVIQLVDSGVIDLDRPVQGYLPRFRLADADSSGRITVRHLLNQTSGLPGSAGYWHAGDEPPESLLERLASVRATRDPGESFEYCNANYEVLGLLVEAVTGERYASRVQRGILEPLGMRHTFVDSGDALRAGLAWGHQSWFGIPVATRDVFSPDIPSAGGMSSSARDMGIYLATLLGGGSYAGGSLASDAGMRELSRPPGEFSDYAMGWSVRTAGDVPMLLHNGGTPQFTSTMAYSPERGFGVVVLTNTNQTPLPYVQLPTRSIVAGAMRMLGGEAVQPSGAAQRFGERLTKWAILLGLGVSILQLMVRDQRRWRHEERSWAQVAGGAAVDLVWVGALLFGAPQLLGLPLSSIVEYTPDLGASLLFGAALGLVRAALRIGLKVRR